MDKITEIALEHKFSATGKTGKIVKRNIEQDYTSHVLSFIDIKKIKPFIRLMKSSELAEETPYIYLKTPL